ncbi:MAG: hypothetical protein QOK21_2523 [Solirubrobacteraceae bacterium]|jgi:FMN phosphatase YigB (HAD superfamily)|nr:hypothetical protein [Solirubrobacteraceae bacterium]
MALRAVVFDVGDTLFSAERAWAACADSLERTAERLLAPV